ncbi:OmpP1/FadL family transporter [Aestuariibaculum sediminum]|uniref:Outer membrane protein transport protein n=1 Tax=Aestuariibaculum sediminum TaxID=2770637 RepID=A0A8J6Q1R0_9FLAO|nr:outer membrane protein transport protein [Aestuariibaculum sediminum]MBD0833182.1 outer membrane protein transport protein [Aestuariibaculum sediminum]
MKTLNLFLLGMLSVCAINAQDISDALRYSQDEIQGTARFRALSGAFGALGGDMSAVSINPASSAVFNASHVSFSLSNTDVKNETQYFNGFNKINTSKFDLNQGGAAFVFAARNNSPWRKFSLSVAYEKTNNHENAWNAIGTNTNDDGQFSNSIASYFYDYANGVRLDEISLNDRFIEDAYQDIGSRFGFGHQQAFLGYQAYVLDPVTDTDDNTSYVANVATGNFAHDYAYISTGYNGKISFNFATQYQDNLYLGLNLNSHFIDYDRVTSLMEDNFNGGDIEFIDFDNSLSTTGNGFSFQLGGILKVTNEFRVGATYDSPTWYTIREETTQYINTNLAEPDVEYLPSIINIYPQYQLQTPGKLTGSLAYIFGTQGLISFDYSYKDYGNTKFKPTSDAFYADQNNIMSNIFTAASTYRIGGEYRIKQLSLRGGYRYEESPYTNGVTVGDLNGFSVGLGYNFGNVKFDLAFDQAQRSFETPLYNVGLIETASIDQTNSNVTFSLSFNL